MLSLLLYLIFLLFDRFQRKLLNMCFILYKKWMLKLYLYNIIYIKRNFNYITNSIYEKNKIWIIKKKFVKIWSIFGRKNGVVGGTKPSLHIRPFMLRWSSSYRHLYSLLFRFSKYFYLFHFKFSFIFQFVHFLNRHHCCRIKFLN